ncbi:hypothetical protein F4860DRAFT_526449 [Xylaria cubensis]|nr:hypothetical protein F4860DRAFT_526449 [Xylaria cubensis]
MALELMRPPSQMPQIPKGSLVIIRHPGYEDEKPLFCLPAFDSIKSDQETIIGVHCLTVLTACGIITGNLFDKVYLSYDKYGQRVVQTHRHSLLRSGSYYLQVKGSEPQPPENGSTTTADGTADSSSLSATHIPYPVVPDFTDWEFPHGKVPKEWEQPYEFKLQSPERCVITASERKEIVEQAHIISDERKRWFEENSMIESLGRNGSEFDNSIDSPLNRIRLRCDLHKLFNRGLFVIVPKPRSVLQSSCTQLPVAATTQQSPAADRTEQLSTAEDPGLVFGVHFLNGLGIREYVESYHNISIRDEDLDCFSLEFLFAHFAWALFPRLNDFFDDTTKRNVKIITIEKTSVQSKKTVFISAAGLTTKGGNTGNKRPRTESTGRGNVFLEWNGFEQDHNGEWRLRSPIEYRLDSESESESEGSDRG